MRINGRHRIRSHRPFETTGASLYAGSTAAGIAFRSVRTLSPRTLHGPLSRATTKTARVAFDASSPLSIDLAAYASSTIYLQLRPCADDVELETNAAPIRLDLDGAGEDATEILGTATLLSVQQRDGGVCRLRFRYVADRFGVVPTAFSARRTAGPSSPAEATTSYVSGQQLYEIDTPALSDASAYTYEIVATRNAVETTLLSGITVTADATGPAAPASGSAAAS